MKLPNSIICDGCFSLLRNDVFFKPHLSISGGLYLQHDYSGVVKQSVAINRSHAQTLHFCEADCIDLAMTIPKFVAKGEMTIAEKLTWEKVLKKMMQLAQDWNFSHEGKLVPYMEIKAALETNMRTNGMSSAKLFARETKGIVTGTQELLSILVGVMISYKRHQLKDWRNPIEMTEYEYEKLKKEKNAEVGAFTYGRTPYVGHDKQVIGSTSDSSTKTSTSNTEREIHHTESERRVDSDLGQNVRGIRAERKAARTHSKRGPKERTYIYKGERLPIKEIAARSGVKLVTLYKRLEKGLTVAKATKLPRYKHISQRK